MSEPARLDVRIATDPAEAWLVQCQIVDWLKERQYPAPDQFGVRLSLEEGLMNAIKHGNRGDLSKSVRVFCEVTDARTYIEIHDQGVGFDPGGIGKGLAADLVAARLDAEGVAGALVATALHDGRLDAAALRPLFAKAAA